MGETLEYDEEEARREEAIYRTPAIAERRRRVREDLDLRAGESVLSVGCGPGFEPAEIARVVGEDGRVCGIDRSGAMLSLAARRCEALPQVALARGDAAALPVADGRFDAAVAVQVYEYLEDVPAAVEELHRVLRPGGRAVVCDADFDSVVWRSANEERMRRVLDAFDDHCPRPHLGSELSPPLREAGFAVEAVEPNTIVNTRLAEDTFVHRLAQSIEEYAAAHEGVGPEEAKAWVEDLREREERGATFFSYTQYRYLVRKPE